MQVYRLGRGHIAQSLYALKMRATIIGYKHPLVVHGSLEPLLGETYLLHSVAHISHPCFSYDLDLHFLDVCSILDIMKGIGHGSLECSSDVL